MNASSHSVLSLYKLAQGEGVLPSVLGETTLSSLVGAFVDLAIAHSCQTDFWLKLTPQDGWWSEIERYQEECENSGGIHFCREASVPLPQSSQQLVSVQLQAGTLREDESFLLLLSPQFSGLLVTQYSSHSERGKVLCLFEASAIARVITGLQSAIAPEKFKSSLANLPLPPTNSSSIAQLLLNQAQRAEQLTTTLSDPQPNQRKDEFFNQGLQELSTTLTHFKTALSLLGAPSLKAPQRQRYLEMLQRECDRQNALICGMRSFIELETLSEEATAVRLSNFVPGIVSTYQPLAMEKGIQLGYTIPAELPPVGCPANWLQQIVVNLLNNSLLFTPPQGQVSVRASLKGKQIELVFKDTGIGIAPGEVNKIFENFYRGRNNLSETNSGAGLGLTSVQQLLRRCGGSISVTSQPDRGSTFTVLLPIAKSQG
ncbi:hypothetical protein IQ249_09310 [Lusitaniella coriacea LEGE 07157]|uniref:histidine kinase n=1 Tax=Lusitaniella coriacea LEGE 07157 TaxID=945747 RepID=A0A8J7DVW9_9CYAN|nr:ATP-binding protein [Lusitaniella coriacea]MBE9116091.1 hypothetical protein [Lusitaniella coriacea LEGE 07157]